MAHSLYQQIQSLRTIPTVRSNGFMCSARESVNVNHRYAEWKRLSKMVSELCIEIVHLQMTDGDPERVLVLEAELAKVEWAREQLKTEYWANR